MEQLRLEKASKIIQSIKDGSLALDLLIFPVGFANNGAP